MPCVFCYAGFEHEPTEECENDSIDLSKPDYVVLDSDSITESRSPGRPQMKGEDMEDVEATGRKRSIRAKPIKPGMICEWAYLKQAGGGVNPIEGCPGNPAQNVHHGPDKSVLNNDPETNLSAICSTCHNRWHVANDEFYAVPRPPNGATWLPDDELADGMQFFELNNHGPKMTKIEALALEMTRNQDDARGRIK